MTKSVECSWWPGTESNRRRQPFQGCLPTMLSGSESEQLHVGEILTRSHLWDCLGWSGLLSPPRCSLIVPAIQTSGFRQRHDLEADMTAAIYVRVSTSHKSGPGDSRLFDQN